MSLVYYDGWMKRKREPGDARPGRGVRCRVRAVAGSASLSASAWLSLLIATGIGLHNFSEGLAIGQAGAQGEISLAVVLIVGFGLHNATEGFGIVAPLSGDAGAAELALPAPPRPDRRRPDVRRHADRAGVGRARRSRSLFLALAAGSILYVVLELANVNRRLASKTLHRLVRARSASSSGSRPSSSSKQPASSDPRTLGWEAWRYASVYPLVSARAVARPFTYEVPDGVGKGAVVAVRVRPLAGARRRRRAGGRAAATA